MIEILSEWQRGYRMAIILSYNETNEYKKRNLERYRHFLQLEPDNKDTQGVLCGFSTALHCKQLNTHQEPL